MNNQIIKPFIAPLKKHLNIHSLCMIQAITVLLFLKFIFSAKANPCSLLLMKDGMET